MSRPPFPGSPGVLLPHYTRRRVVGLSVKPLVLPLNYLTGLRNSKKTQKNKKVYFELAPPVSLCGLR